MPTPNYTYAQWKNDFEEYGRYDPNSIDVTEDIFLERWFTRMYPQDANDRIIRFWNSLQFLLFYKEKLNIGDILVAGREKMLIKERLIYVLYKYFSHLPDCDLGVQPDVNDIINNALLYDKRGEVDDFNQPEPRTNLPDSSSPSSQLEFWEVLQQPKSKNGSQKRIILVGIKAYPFPDVTELECCGGAVVSCWIKHNSIHEAVTLARRIIRSEGWYSAAIIESYFCTRNNFSPEYKEYYDAAVLDGCAFVYIQYPKE